MKTIVRNIFGTKTISLFVILVFISSPIGLVNGLDISNIKSNPLDDFDTSSQIQNSINLDDSHITTPLAENDNLGDLLDDNNNTYGKTWDPWLTRAAIHAVATHDDWLALASGYLYDNQVHLYRWNYQTDQYDLVWEVGGGIFQSDVMTLDFADTDHNNLIEIVAGGEDGRVYVFEQRHIYDPVTNSENMFDLVWKSPRMGRIFDLVVEDTDGDYKEDIIVGTGEYVRFYEYEDHGGYPFSEDHWIEYEEVFTIKVTDALTNYTGLDRLYSVTGLAVADTNTNGLWEIVVGTRAGTVFLLENNGTVVDINGVDFPYMRDDNYEVIWDSGNSIQRPITDMEAGDLDGDGYKEILMAVQGQGAYILDEIDGIFGTYRLQRPYDKWESDPKGAYPLDQYVDWMTNSSSLKSVDGEWAEFTTDNFTYYGDWNVYTEYMGSNVTTHGDWPEPLTNDASNGMPEIFPYRTATAQPEDDIFTVFDASTRDAWAYLDFGRHEEAAGNGITTLYDMEVILGSYSFFSSGPSINWTLSLSLDNSTWYDLNMSTDVKFVNRLFGDDYYEIEVDRVLNELGWDFYRFVKVNISDGILKIDAIKTRFFNKPISDAQSVAIGTLTLKGQTAPTTVGYIGTVNGAILAIYWNSTSQDYEVVWDSWTEERYKLNKNIFDLEGVQRQGTFPAWLDLASQSYTLDFSSGLPGGTDVFSYDIDNFYNYRDAPNLDFIFTATNGSIYAYRQTSPSSPPNYDSDLTDYLFNLDLLNLQATYGMPGSVQSWMNSQSGTNYFTASIVPMDFDIETDDSPYHEIESGYFLFVSKWDGKHNATTRTLGQVDTSVWYLFNFPNEGSLAEVCDPLPRCASFIPVFNNITEAGGLVHKTLTNSELTGQMYGIFGQSTWAPKVNGYDALGDDSQDLIVTNGKVHLLETTSFHTPTPGFGPVDTMFGDLQTVLKPGYFDTINEDSKGRVWTNAEPVDFDNDGDMDLILGFARYDDLHFNVDKVSYGFTYWENDGTATDPIWIEKKKAVTNNDPDSNFRVHKWADPVMVFDDYDFGEDGFDPVFGYHPAYRTNRATRLFMFQPSTDTNLFKGTMKQFVADYTHPTSLLLATYPEAKRVDINLQYQLDPDAINYGFHIFETWDNSDELREWTLTVETGDLDQDGDKEVIVGDFNNNAYVFEHLTNNTFKRAFRSYDFNRSIVTDQSPYAHEQFDGISGEFKRTLFEHVEYLMTGVDLNENGLLEFVAATQDMIFIYENVYTPGGFFQQDTFKLIKIIDILNHPAVVKQDPTDTKITALAMADDITFDGRKELLVGVTSALLIFEVSEDPFGIGDLLPIPAEDNHSIGYETEEIFFRNTGPYLGQYKLPGNYHLFPDLKINSIVVDDIDQDGYLDIILAGRDRTKAVPIQDGFVDILWFDGAEYRYTLDSDPVFHDTILYNPINDLEVDDQDFDGKLELYLAHESGIDIYEFTAPGVAELMEVITSDPHYQLPTRAYNLYPTVRTGSPGDYTFLSPSWVSDDKDITRLSNGSLGMVIIGTYGGEDMVVYTVSNDDGITWSYAEIVEAESGGTYNNFIAFESPTLYENRFGFLYFGYVARDRYNFGAGPFDTLGIHMTRRIGTNSYNTKIPIGFNDLTLEHDADPTIYQNFENIYNTDVGIAYLNSKSELIFGRYDRPSGSYVNPVSFPWANGSIGPEFGGHYILHSIDIVQLDYDLPASQRQNYGLVFSGYLQNETLSFDHDLFFAPFTMNATYLYNFTRPTRTYFSGIPAYHPSIIQERVTGNLLVTFEQSALRPYGGLHAIWSDDLGLSWQGPYDMSHLLGIDPEGINAPFGVQPVSSESKESYRVGTFLDNLFLTRFNPTIPVVATGGYHGFTMVYSIDYDMTLYPNPETSFYCAGYTKEQSTYLAAAQSRIRKDSYCDPITITFDQLVSAINYHSNFSWFKLGGATEVDLGDSDRDGRREILAASGKHAFLFEFRQNNATHILHSQQWMSEEYFYGVSDVAIGDINGNGFEELVVTSERGTVNAFSLIDLNQTQVTVPKPSPVARGSGVSTSPVDPFIFLGSDFTIRTDFIAQDITGDGVDDVMVIDDYFIGISDTYQLRFNESYNDVIWAHDVPEFGRYLQSYLIFDLDNDGSDEIIVAFEKVITAINIETGKFMWNNTYLIDVIGDLYDRFRNIRLQAQIETDGDRFVLVTSDLWWTGDSNLWGSIYYISASNSTTYPWAEKNYSVVKLVSADLTGDSALERLVVYRNISNPIDHYIQIWKEDFSSLIYDTTVIGLPPITNVVTGDFDQGTAGDEFMLFMDLAALGFLFGINWWVFPTIYWTLAFDGTNIILPSTTSFMGLSPFSGLTLNSWVLDLNQDADSQDDLVGQGWTGGMFTMSTVDTGTFLYQYPPDTFTTFGVPYARHNTLIGNYCDPDGKSFVTTTSAVTIACYRELDFSTDQSAVWASDAIDFDVIRELVPGDFDGDGNSDDIMVIGYFGFVYIYDNSFDGSSLNNQLNLEISKNFIEMIKSHPWILVVLPAIIAIPVLVVNYREKIRKLLRN